MFFRKMQQNQALAKDQPCPLSIKSVDYREANQSSQQGVLLDSTQHTHRESSWKCKHPRIIAWSLLSASIWKNSQRLVLT